MSETKWSPEPWRPNDAGAIEDREGNPVCSGDDYAVDWTFWEVYPDNRRRVLACVNALAGIPTEALEAGALDRALHWLALLDRRGGLGIEVHPGIQECLRALGRLP